MNQNRGEIVSKQMASCGSKTAVLLFTQTVIDECHDKHLIPNDVNGNKLLANIFIKNTVKSIQKSKLPYFIISSAQQHGNNFGEKLTDACMQVFNAGFDNVIAVGNDCPELSTEDISLTEQKLLTHDVVLGPAKDGGVYLIGISKYSFDLHALAALPWKEINLFNQFTTYIKTNHYKYFILKEKQDIDTWKDLNNIIIHSKKYLFLNLVIKNILASAHKIFSGYKLFLHISNFNQFSSLRSPPDVS